MFSNKKSDVIPLVLACLSGLLLFQGIYGFDLLNPANTDWCILKTSDTSQHFLGGWAFLRDQWRWPLGLFYGLSGSDPTSISLVDGIPLAAFAAKLICGPVSTPIQYLGIWTAISFILQGFFAMLLMKKLTSNTFFQFTGVFFLLVSVPFLNLGQSATALSSHFFILWALYLMLEKWSKKTIFQWIILLACSLLVHPYIAAMCGAVYCGTTFQVASGALKKGDKKTLLNIGINWISVCLLLLVLMYICGIFYIRLEGSAMVFGQSQINLNCLINPQTGTISALVAPMPVPMEAENLYTGVGAWLLLIFFLPSLWKLLKRNSSLWKYYGFGVLFLICMVLFAINCRIYMGKELLMHFVLPPEIKQLAGIFRAAGRFAWPAWYMVLAMAIARLAKEKSFTLKYMVAAAAILLQIYDLGNGIISFKWAARMAEREKKYQCPYARFEPFIKGKKKLYYSCRQEDFAAPVYFAIKNNILVDSFYFPRKFYRSRETVSFNEVLKQENLDRDTVYILSANEVADLHRKRPDLKKYVHATSERSIMFLP